MYQNTLNLTKETQKILKSGFEGKEEILAKQAENVACLLIYLVDIKNNLVKITAKQTSRETLSKFIGDINRQKSINFEHPLWENYQKDFELFDKMLNDPDVTPSDFNFLIKQVCEVLGLYYDIFTLLEKDF